MGKAPRPGANRKQQEANVVLTITVGDESRAFNPNNVPLKVRVAFRKAHGGMPFEQFMADEESFGLDSLAAMWWLAGQVNGNDTETADDALALIQATLDERGEDAFNVDASFAPAEITEDTPPS